MITKLILYRNCYSTIQKAAIKGQVYSMKHKFSEKDVVQFSELSTDKNPLHINETYAKQSIFKQRVVHGILTSSLFSALMGNIFNGIYLSQTLSFVAPVYFDEELEARITITDIIEKKSNKKILVLETLIEKIKTKELAIKGEAKLLI